MRVGRAACAANPAVCSTHRALPDAYMIPHATLPGQHHLQIGCYRWPCFSLASLHIWNSAVNMLLHCSQRQEHTSRLLEAVTQQAEDAGISDEEPDVQLALMAAEMRCK